LTATAASASSIDLSWNAATDDTGVTGYNVFRNGTKVGTTSGRSYTDSGLSAATSYSYYVTARDAAGNESAHSNTASATTSGSAVDVTAPSAPSGLATSNVTTSSINLSWNAATDDTGVTSYNVYRNNTKIGTTSTLTYSDTGLNALTSYSYYVTARDAAGNESAHSNTASATTKSSGADTTQPSAPTSLAATAASSSSINLSWNAATDDTGVTGYSIFRNGTKVGSPTGLSYVDSGLNASTSYSYYVTAHDAANNQSAHSNTASATTKSGGTTGNGMWMGARRVMGTGATFSLSEWQKYSTLHGPWVIGRTFEFSIPGTVGSTDAGSLLSVGAIPWDSIGIDMAKVAAGTYDSALAKYAASFPKNSPCYLTLNHETETKDTAANFRAAYQHAYPVIKAANPNLQFGPIHAASQWVSGNNTDTPSDWDVGANSRDFESIDVYFHKFRRPYGNIYTHPGFKRWYDYFSTRESNLAVTELGYEKDTGAATERANALQATGQWLADHNFISMQYWDSDHQFEWEFDGEQGMIDVYKALCANGRQP
jgi:chitodextrinase